MCRIQRPYNWGQSIEHRRHVYRVQVAVSTGYRGLGTEYRWLLVQNTGGCRHRVQVAVGTEFRGEVQSTETRHLEQGPWYRVQGPWYRVQGAKVQSAGAELQSTEDQGTEYRG